MPLLSLATIMKNEENNIEKCLNSFKDVVQEIVVVDTGSTDKSIEIAKKFTDKVYSFKWCNDFSAARNFSFEKTTGDWIIWADFDDILLPKDQEKIRTLDYTNKEIVICKYIYSHDEFGAPECILERERIIKRSLNLKWQKKIHECLPLTAKLDKEDIEIHHYKNHASAERNLKILEQIVKKDPDPRNIFYLGRELTYVNQDKRAIKLLERFVTLNGWWEDTLCAFSLIAQCYKKANNEQQFLKNIFRSIQIEPRRAEDYYDLGVHYMSKNDWYKAIHWFELCLAVKRNPELLSTYYPQLYTWKPALDLCVCYNNIGDFKKSYEANEIFLKFRPNDSRGHNNKKLLSNVLKSISNNVAQNNNIQSNNKQNKKIKIGWVCPENWEAAQSRIRVLNVDKYLKQLGWDSNIISWEQAKNYDIVIVGKEFSENALNNIKNLKQQGKIVLCDICESLFTFPWFKEILEICDQVICCSKTLAEQVVEKANKNVIVIEDALETIEEKSLLDMVKNYDTDKQIDHNYMAFYNKVFEPLRYSAKKILEIGVAKGGSVYLWHDYFVNAQIIGVDFFDKKYLENNKYPRFKVFQGDQEKREYLEEFVKNNNNFDIALDDGSHTMQGQQLSLGVLWKALKPGGIYVCEDIHTSLHRSNEAEWVGGCCRDDFSNSTLVALENLEKSKIIKSEYMTEVEQKYIEDTLESCKVIYSKGESDNNHITSILRKKQNDK